MLVNFLEKNQVVANVAPVLLHDTVDMSIGGVSSKTKFSLWGRVLKRQNEAEPDSWFLFIVGTKLDLSGSCRCDGDGRSSVGDGCSSVGDSRSSVGDGRSSVG
jgi:hypothetical protein